MTETSSIVNILGAGSGIDMAALANNLAAAQFELRNQRLSVKSETLERQITAASSLKNKLTLFANALGDRVRVGDLASKPAVANSAVASASSPLGTSGKGSYSLEVTKLASSQTLSSTAFADSTSAVGEGTLTLRFGTTTASSFTEDTGQSAVTIDIAAGSTLTDIASAINAKGTGVTAYVAQTQTGAQLVFKGQEGQQSGFIVEANETGGGNLGDLAWNPSAGGNPAQLIAQSDDAAFKLDGLAMTSKSNKTGQIAPGLELTLTGTNVGAPTTVKFADPSANISSAMEDIVGALNEVATELRDAANPLGGDLSRDPGARALKRAFSQLASEVIMPNAPEGAPRTLSDLGLVTGRDGTYRLDTARLQQTLSRDPEGAAAMFTNGLYGVYSTIDRISRSASKTGDPGSLGGSIVRYEKQSREISEDVSELAEKQEVLRASLASRFGKADVRIAASQATLSFLQSQIDVWNSSRD